MVFISTQDNFKLSKVERYCMDIFNLAWFLKNLFSNNDSILSQKSFSSHEWYDLYTLALEHKVESIIYRQLCLNKKLIMTVPSVIQRALRSAYKYNYLQNSYGIQEANHIAKMCYEAGIQICAVKGIDLLNDVYTDIGVRPMQDIDFLSFYDKYEEIDYLLKRNDYAVAMINDKILSDFDNQLDIQSVLYKKKKCYPAYDQQLSIDIAFKNRNYNIGDLIERSVYSVKSKEWRSLLPADFALLLCFELHKDALERNPKPLPENCSIGKLIDIIGYIHIHHINREVINTVSVVEYAQECAYSLFGKKLFK